MNSLLDSPLKAPPPPSELDELMSRDPLSLASVEIDKIIAMQRAYRARKETPGGGKKKSDLKDATGVDLAALLRGAPLQDGKPKPTPVITKPSAGGFRRI